MLHREFMACGYRIFPLWPIDSTTGACTCGNSYCLGAGKHPRATNWQNTPIWDDEQVDAMEQYSGLATGYGVLCKGLLVVDVDARNGGMTSYAKLIEEYPEVLGAGLVVDTGSGGGSKHLYFSLPESEALVGHLPDFGGLDFKSSGFVVGPGSAHKSGRAYSIADGSPNDIGPAPERLLAALRKPERHRTEYNGLSLDVSHADISDMLRHIPNDDLPYDEWVKVGMAIHQATGGTGYDLWEEWSEKCAKHDAALMQTRWHSFGRSANPVTIGTLIYHAEHNDWQMPVTFTPEVEFELPPVEVMPDGLPFDITGCDLTSPPGFIGDVARWIESQSRRPRLHLSVATALTAMGNITGLHYIDKKDGVTANLMCFCIAGSRTGKESVQQALTEVHRVAGIAAATHGSIKSEQEITRNLVRHQAAFYSIDEVGIFLKKIKNAQTRGGAAYLDGVIGELMKIYSKANAWMLLTGDGKEEIRKQLIGEMAGHQRRVEENTANPSTMARLESLQKQLDSIDQGLHRPFLSLIGFTTPVTFDSVVDYDSATNGFVGRSLLFNERDTAPRTKLDYRRIDMPEGMQATIRQLASGGSFDVFATGTRIENSGERVEIPSDARASQMLNDVLVWCEDQANVHKGTSGLESLWLGAYELVSKVSFILAIPEGLRTSEHVRWAFALIKRDVEEKIRLVTANDREKDAPALAMHAKIGNLCSGEDGETIGVLVNRMRGKKKEDIEKIIDDMVSRGTMKRIETKHPRNGKTFVRFKYVGE